MADAACGGVVNVVVWCGEDDGVVWYGGNVCGDGGVWWERWYVGRMVLLFTA